MDQTLERFFKKIDFEGNSAFEGVKVLKVIVNNKN